MERTFHERFEAFRAKRALKRQNKVKRNRSVFFFVSFALLCLYTLTLLIPLFWAIMNSMKDRIEFMTNPFGFPSKIAFKNFAVAYENLVVPVSDGVGTRNAKMLELFFNTFLYSVGCTFFATMSPCIVAYAVSKYKFKLAKVIYSFVIVAMLLPIVGSLPSEMLVVRALGFYDNMVGAWIMKGGFLGMYFLVFYASWKSFSWDYAEAAFIDGASHLRVLVNVMLPLCRSTIFAVALLVFIGFWNEYYTQLVYMPSYPSITYGLWKFQFNNDARASSTTVQLAGSTIVCLPVLILFLIFKNKLIGNVAVGGIKG